MRNRRAVVLLSALALGALAAVAVWSYLGSVEDRADRDARLVGVFVVKHDVAQGLGGDQAIAQGLIQPDRVPEKFRPSTAITDLASIQGKVALTNLFPGQIVGRGAFIDPAAAPGSFAQRIPRDQVAVTVEVDRVRGVANLIVPGDKVNILVVTPDGARPLYQRVDVIAVGTTASPKSATDRTANATPAEERGLVTFAVPMVAAEKIALASSTAGPGALYLTLARPDSPAVPTPPVGPAGLYQGPLSPYA